MPNQNNIAPISVLLSDQYLSNVQAAMKRARVV
jgi:hypothetical protein